MKKKNNVAANSVHHNKNRGITLIALVITIIVMLILVTVTIRVATNGNLFTHAANAVKDVHLLLRPVRHDAGVYHDR